jgi:hypothetical protein
MNRASGVHFPFLRRSTQVVVLVCTSHEAVTLRSLFVLFPPMLPGHQKLLEAIRTCRMSDSTPMPN